MEADQTREGTPTKAEGVVTDKLADVEAKVDTAIQDVIHEARNEAQEVVDHTMNRVKGAWEAQRPKIEQFMAAHPWAVLGALLLLGYLLSSNRRSQYQERLGS